jgi:gliding motility-associated lipoprotein GldH
MVKTLYILLLPLFMLLFTSCSEEPFYSATTDMQGEVWHYNEPAEFSMQVTDTVSAYDVFIDVRTNKSYAYNNLYVFLDMVSEDGNPLLRDTVELPLADKTGKWTGTVTGSLVENHVLTYQGLTFKKSDKYTFILTQAMMREDDLQGIASVGISLYSASK